MHRHKPKTRALRAVSLRAQIGQAALGLCVLALVASSAIVFKELKARRSAAAPLAVVDSTWAEQPHAFAAAIVDPLADTARVDPPSGMSMDLSSYEQDTSIRWFNGRPVRPVREIWMTVTAYSPDSRSCGDSADDITASNHHVQTNAFQLVAADSRVLPLGSMISIPGYAEGHVVPVLDRGGKIKGNRLDVLFPTHEIARKWGVKKLKVVVWGYADGKAAGDWRRIRDGK